MSRQHLTCAALLAAAIIARPAPAGSPGLIQLDDQTAERLIASPELGSADPEEKDYAWGDVDQDGDVDLVVVRKHPTAFPGGRRNVLFINEGIKEGRALNGVLVDRTLEFAVDSDVEGDQGFLAATPDRDVQLADLNGDGWLDIVTAAMAGDGLPKHLSHPRIYVNQGEDASGAWQGFRYEDARIPQLSPIAADGFPHGPRFNAVGMGDVTGDGAPDLFFADTDWIGDAELFDVNNRLLVNDGNGFFSDQTEQRLQSNMFDTIASNASAVADMNGDGANDLLVHFTDDFYYVQFAYNAPRDPGHFAVMVPAFFSSYYTTDVSIGDLNDDGKLDFVTSEDGINHAFINQGNGAGGLAEFDSTSLPGGGGGGGESVIADLDGDGLNDIIMSDMYYVAYDCVGATRFHRNLGDVPNVHFNSEQPVPDGLASGVHDAAVLDLDGDGLREVILGRCSGTSIWKNTTSAVAFSYPDGLPGTFIPPNQALPLPVQVQVQGPAGHAGGSPMLHVSIEGVPLQPVPLEPAGGDLFIATLPALNCPSQASFYVEAVLTDGSTFTDPTGAPADQYVVYSAQDTLVAVDDNLEGDISGWQVLNDPSLVGGAWELADPNPDTGVPDEDASPDGVLAFVTENGPPYGSPDDVDGGPTILMTPVFDAEANDARVRFSYWFYCYGNVDDELDVSISGDGGATWTLVQSIAQNTGVWREATFTVGSFMTPTSTMRMRFSVIDRPENSITEAAIDEFRVELLFCGTPLPGDVNGDGLVDVVDLLAVLGAWGFCPNCELIACPADIDGDCDVDVVDLLTVLANWS